MKQLYKKAALTLALACFLGMNLFAQPLNGAYTLDNTQPSSATNFTSFTQLAAALNANGVSGPVTVNVGITSGPYNEQVIFNQATGISATNSVTINGNGRILSFNSASSTAPHTLLLNGADYMFIHNLEVRGLGTTYALAVHLYNQANFNEFHGCKFNTPLNGTSSIQVPFSISGNATSATAVGNSGNGNIVNTCTMSGGYYNTVLYGNSTTPYNVDNQILNSHIVDFYVYGIYHVYNRKTIIQGNVIERVNRTTMTTAYAIMLTSGSFGVVMERNHIRRLFDGAQPNANSAYCFYIGAAASQQEPHIIRNNLVSDIRTNGQAVGFYVFGGYVTAEHNTISLDDVGSTYNGVTYGGYFSTANNWIFRNNIMTMTRGGGSASNRVALYFPSATGLNGFTSYNNVYYVNGATSGTNNIAYVPSVYYPTLASWQAVANQDGGSQEVDPQYVNPANYDYSPTEISINNIAVPTGLNDDFTQSTRSQAMPDPGAFEFYTAPCSVVSGAPSFAVPSGEVCPGATLSLLLNASTFTNSGYTIQWMASTLSIVGGYGAVSGATTNAFATSPLNVNSFFRAVLTCTNSNASTTTVPQAIMVAAPSQSTVPYHEGFEATAWNELPNCSWMSSIPTTWPNKPTDNTPGSGNRLPRNGTGFAVFTASLSGTQNFVTNDIYLEPGITYSASMWYITQTPGFQNDWSELTMLVGQSSSSQQTIATIQPVTGVLYQPLSNTFAVTAPGFYNVEVRATAGGGTSPYLSWDDLDIIIPCSHNSPNLNMVMSSSTVCAGNQVHLNAIGAHTYTWSNGANGPNTVETVLQTSNITVIGTNTLSGCSTTLTQQINVNPSPLFLLGADDDAICLGQSVKLMALAAESYTYAWAHGPVGNIITEAPQVTTTYSATAQNSFGCYSFAIKEVTVYPLPLVSLSGPTAACIGDHVTITGSGGNTYMWTTSQNITYQGNPLVFTAQQSAQITMFGTDNNGCAGTDNVVLLVQECTGLAEANASALVNIYPNPASGDVTVETGEAGATIVITDITARLIDVRISSSGVEVFDVRGLSAGVYYVAVKRAADTEIRKLIVQ